MKTKHLYKNQSALLLATHTFLVALFTNPYIVFLFANAHGIFTGSKIPVTTDPSMIAALAVISEIMFLISLVSFGVFLLRGK